MSTKFNPCRRCMQGLLACLGTLAFACTAAEESPYADTIYGDWSGRRTQWNAAGYDWQLGYKADLVARLSEGSSRRVYGLGNLELKLNLDGSKVFGIDNGHLLFHLLSNHGAKPAREYNRLPHGLDNIEVPYNANTTKLYQLYWDQGFLNDRVGLLFGLFDLNSEFYSTESSGRFLQPTFGIGAEMGGSGRNGPSIFPTPALALRLRAETESGIYGRIAVFDGVPGDPNNLHGTHVQLGKGDGSLGVAEVGFGKLVGGRLAVGAWRYTNQFPDLVDIDANGNPVSRPQRGAYLLAEKRLLEGDKSPQVDAFFRYGRTVGDSLQFDRALATGLMIKGFSANRPDDEFGVAFAEEGNSSKWRSTQANAPARERSLEWVYRYRAMPGLVIQPSLQYLINHAVDTTQDASWYALVRCELSF